MKLFKRKSAKIICSIFVPIAILICACGVYLGDYYRAETEALSAFATSDSVEKREIAGGDLVFAPENAKAGLIFYPGGKVEHSAYEPLMRECAER